MTEKHTVTIVVDKKGVVRALKLDDIELHAVVSYTVSAATRSHNRISLKLDAVVIHETQDETP